MAPQIMVTHVLADLRVIESLIYDNKTEITSP